MCPGSNSKKPKIDEKDARIARNWSSSFPELCLPRGSGFDAVNEMAGPHEAQKHLVGVDYIWWMRSTTFHVSVTAYFFV